MTEVQVVSPKVMILPGGRDGNGRVDRNNYSRAVGRSPKTCSEWQRLGIGPRGYLIGGRIYYDWSEVKSFITTPESHEA